MKINFKQCNQANFMDGRSKAVSYIVIHYTANKGDTAKNNADYFARENVGASAHYFVDENEIWQSVKDSDTAWHCGGKRQSNKGGEFFGICQNSNSIGVEICMNDKSGNVRQKSIDNAVQLVRYLMQRYGVPIDRVIRHYDVTGKFCPLPMVSDEKLWNKFKSRLEDDDMTRYDTLAECPSWAQATVQKLMARGLINGTGTGLDLSEDMLRIFVINDRAGLYQ